MSNFHITSFVLTIFFSDGPQDEKKMENIMLLDIHIIPEVQKLLHNIDVFFMKIQVIS
jgi:hypothetical protein